ncbi:hypothetical protein [Proteiniclasticum ruminis]|nr:hypothetical protein [Proteiniclasticum ruminis]
MNVYKKPNLMLPVSLHDARVEKITFKAGENPLSGELILYFPEGFRAEVNKKWIATGPGEVRFGGIDWDFSAIRYYEGDSVKERSFEEFKEDLTESSWEIVDESYGYNRSVFSGYRYQDGFFRVEMEIYHFKETEYHYEEPMMENEVIPSL